MATTASSRIHYKPDETDQTLLNALQSGLRFVREPFAEIGERISMAEAEVLSRIQRLKDAEIIRQVSAIFDTRALGYTSTLVAAAYPVVRRQLCDGLDRAGQRDALAQWLEYPVVCGGTDRPGCRSRGRCRVQ